MQHIETFSEPDMLLHLHDDMIVDHRTAYKYAQQKIYSIRQSESAIAESRRVFVKHGSRKKRDPLPKSPKPNRAEFTQLSLFDELEPRPNGPFRLT